MIVTPVWRTRLFGTGAGLIAIWLGVAIADQEFFWPALASLALLLFALSRWQPLPLETVIVGLALAGYIVGNRGFAQITLLPHQPLLPAECVLVFCGALLLVHSAWRHELPFRRDPLNVLLLLWIALGSIRVAFDFRSYGLVAIRDYALVYYAGFFFLAQEAARNPGGRRFLERVVLASCVVLLVTSFLFDRFPDFFLSQLSFRGNPLIYYKGDLVGTFLAVGAVLAYLRYEPRRQPGFLLLSLLLAGAVLATNNRASMFGLGVATAWLAIGGRWKFAAAQILAGGLAGVLLLLAAGVMNVPLEKTPLFGVYERVVSLADPTGNRTYRGTDTFNKGDNNLFRTVWWKAVIGETVERSPFIGIGFGYDLADRFVREYYPESGEEFSVRSPHNVLVTVFARMGFLGIGALLAIMGVLARRTWRAVRAGPQTAGSWCAAWVILSSACFGVVLEGPMGAVVFWSLLGMAQASTEAHNDAEISGGIEKGRAPALPSESSAA